MTRIAVTLLVLALTACSGATDRPACLASRPLVDVGHTPQAPGAISASGATELAFNRRFAARLVQSLRERGIGATLLTVEGDDPRLDRRVAAIADATPSLIVSIHHDSVQERYLKTRTVGGVELSYTESAAGFSLFVPTDAPTTKASLLLAEVAADALLGRGERPNLLHGEPIEGESRRILDPARGIYAGDYIKILRTAEAPAVLIEVGVIKNPAEEQRLADPPTVAALADAVANAVAGLPCRISSAAAARTAG